MSKCYICGSNKAIEGHHVIPPAAGGEKGPVVDLCGNCHTSCHKMALNLESKTVEKVMLFSDKEWPRAKPLVGYIIQAIRQNKNNPDFSNPATLQVKLTKHDIFLLHLIKEDAGYSNLNLYVRDAIKALIKSKFPTK